MRERHVQGIVEVSSTFVPKRQKYLCILFLTTEGKPYGKTVSGTCDIFAEAVEDNLTPEEYLRKKTHTESWGVKISSMKHLGAITDENERHQDCHYVWAVTLSDENLISCSKQPKNSTLRYLWAISQLKHLQKRP